MTLLPFNDSDAHFTLSATLEWTGNVLSADYIIRGPLQNIRHLSTVAEPNLRAHGLWKTTCFEWFLKPTPGDAYWEANFSSQGDWNLYYLEGYRKNLIEESRISTIQLSTEKLSDEWRMNTRIDFSPMTFAPGQLFKAHLSAVVETVDDKKNYWSLKHSQSQPDFHHPDHFILEIQKEF